MSEPYATEEWRPVVGQEGTYSVSDAGRIRSEFTRRGQTRLLNLRPNKQGYLFVRLVVGGRKKDVRVHGIVAAAFIGPRPPGYHVNHINFIRTDNRPSNLEYVTPAQNVAHSSAAGRNGGYARSFSDDQVRELRALLSAGYTKASIARHANVSRETISALAHGRTYRLVKR